MEKYTIENLINDHLDGKTVFPLQTIATLAKKWDVHRDVVYRRIEREDKFPPHVSGLTADKPNKNKVFANYLVEKYEKEKGIKNE